MGIVRCFLFVCDGCGREAYQNYFRDIPPGWCEEKIPVIGRNALFCPDCLTKYRKAVGKYIEGLQDLQKTFVEELAGAGFGICVGVRIPGSFAENGEREGEKDEHD